MNTKNPENHIYELPDFRKIGPYSSGDHFSESCSPRKMMQNRIDEIFWGQTFKNTHYFNLWASGSWTWDLGTRILVPRSWYQDLWGNRSLHDGGTALSANPNRYPFVTVRTPQASLVGEKHVIVRHIEQNCQKSPLANGQYFVSYQWGPCRHFRHEGFSLWII